MNKQAAQQLMDGSLEGTRVVHLCIFELAGKRAYGKLSDVSKSYIMR